MAKGQFLELVDDRHLDSAAPISSQYNSMGKHIELTFNGPNRSQAGEMIFLVAIKLPRFQTRLFPGSRSF